MSKEFFGKNYWAVVLGGSSGLGLASAKKLARHGMNVCIVHRDLRASMPAAEAEFDVIRTAGAKLLTYNTDALKPDSRSSVLDELKKGMGTDGSVRVLLHSIAKGNLKPMTGGSSPELGGDDYRLTINSMAVSLYEWTKEIYSRGMFAPDARVISFTSEGSGRAWKHYAAVSAAKAALEAITRSIALEFAPYGIRANCIMAGVTRTGSFDIIPGSGGIAAHYEARNPFGRLTTPEDVADAVYLLALDEAGWINGAVVPVNGGETIA